jgi:MOSC domain-containing protein YiiM
MIKDRQQRTLAELHAGLLALPQASKNSGTLEAIVCRRSPGHHESLSTVHLTVEQGVPGDEWNRRVPQHPDAQLTVIRRDIAELIGCGQPLTTSGDNLVVNLDLSAENLPVGTRLRVGRAIVEVTPKAHNGCSKFQARFGQDALLFVQFRQTRHLNLRGIYWRVIESGEARVGDPMQVISRSHEPERAG